MSYPWDHREEDHSTGKKIDTDYRTLILETFASGMWDDDIVSQVSEHTGTPCTIEMVKPYYEYAYGEIKVGEDLGVCIAKFKLNHKYGGIFGPGPSRA